MGWLIGGFDFTLLGEFCLFGTLTSYLGRVVSGVLIVDCMHNLATLGLMPI